MNLHQFYVGESFDAYEYFGAHVEKEGVTFRVYAPNAKKIQLIGEFNGWEGGQCEMRREGSGGVYTALALDAKPGMMYKYRIFQADGRIVDRADPYAFGTELRPNTASVIADLNSFSFTDREWIQRRDKNYTRPMNIYEMHFGSWRKKAGQGEGWYTYRELCSDLIAYLKENHFNYIEFLPLSEHPADESWGYQVSGFFSPTSRYGTAEELMYLINECHANGIGALMDFVPVHFVVDDYALSMFDGTPLYEYPSRDTGYSEWGSYNFNYYRGEVRSFLQSAANYWVEKYHFDGLRMDAISNALYWQGDSGRGVNPGAVEFIKYMNSGLHHLHPNVLLIAEDSSNFPKVTAPVEYGGLGFDYKWDMGWMNDTLKFFELAPGRRKLCYGQLCFSMDYFYNELYLLPFSHDEVVHGKKTILDKMYGSYEEKFAQCRSLYTYMFTHPGKKLNFMGNEFGQLREWDEKREQDWDMLTYPAHDSFRHYFRTLCKFYETAPALFEKEYDSQYFKWLPAHMGEGCVFAFERSSEEQKLVILMNAGDKAYEKLAVEYDGGGILREILNSDRPEFGGSGVLNPLPIEVTEEKATGRSVFTVALAPYSSCILEVVTLPAKKKGKKAKEGPAIQAVQSDKDML